MFLSDEWRRQSLRSTCPTLPWRESLKVWDFSENRNLWQLRRWFRFADVCINCFSSRNRERYHISVLRQGAAWPKGDGRSCRSYCCWRGNDPACRSLRAFQSFSVGWTSFLPPSKLQASHWCVPPTHFSFFYTQFYNTLAISITFCIEASQYSEKIHLIWMFCKPENLSNLIIDVLQSQFIVVSVAGLI